MRDVIRCGLFVCCGFFAPNSTLLAADWPQFRGPLGNGIATDSELPTEWSTSQSIAWQRDLPGAGWSTPIVVSGKVFFTCTTPAEGDQQNFELHCLDLATGESVWNKVCLTEAPRIEKHRDNTYATETPVSDGQRIVVYFGMHGMFCFDLAGNELWKKDLGAFEMDNGWGSSSSPVMADGLVFQQVDNEEKSFLVALDVETGEQRWRVERPNERSNWSTPFVWKNSQRTELVTCGQQVISYDPATGKVLWSVANPGRSSATPVGDAERLVFGAEDRSDRGGGPGGLCAVKPGAEGELATDSPFVLWSNQRAALGIASPLLYEGCVYVPNRRGGLVGCYDATTGEELYRQRLKGNREFWASPWAAGGKVFLLDDRGATHVLAPGKEFEVLAINQLEGRFWASVAAAEGRVLLRSEDKLFCVK